MVDGIGFKQVGQLLSQAVKKGSLQAQVGKEATKQVVGTAQQLSIEAFGFDFTGLFMKLIFFFALNFLFAKFMEAIIFTRGIWVTVARLLGIQIPPADQVPDTIKKLFDGGLGGFKFWDIVKLLAILLVVWEYFNYRKAQLSVGKSTSPLTTGVFVSIIGFLSITALPQIFKRLKTTDFNLEQFR